MPKLKGDGDWRKRKSALDAEPGAGGTAAGGGGFSTELTPVAAGGGAMSKKRLVGPGANSSSGPPRPHPRASTLQIVGKKMGAAQLRWCKNNWVLVALIIFALLGLLVAIIMMSLPCEPIFTDVSVTVTENKTVDVVTRRVQCSIPQLSGTTVHGDCPAGYDRREQRDCAEPKCVDRQTGEDTTDVSKCRAPVPAGTPCQTAQCFTAKTSVQCTLTHVCVDPNDPDRAPEPEACGAMSVKKCSSPLGGETIINEADSCPAVSVCNYCETSDLQKLVYPPSGICPQGSTKIVRAPPCQPAIEQQIVTVDVDGMVLLDNSGSVGNENFVKQADVASEVITTFKNQVDNDHLKLGAVVWSSRIDAVQDISSDLETVNNTALGWSNSRPGKALDGWTEFANPLAVCYDQIVLDSSKGHSTSADAFKMCMLITDGENKANDVVKAAGDVCTDASALSEGACADTCGQLGQPTPLVPDDTCSADELAYWIREEGRVKVISVCVACPGDTAKINAYCHSACSVNRTVADCAAFVADKTATELENECPYFVNADDFDVLGPKLVDLATTLTSSLGTVTVTRPAGTANAVAAPATVATEGQQTQVAQPSVTSASASNATASVDSGTVEDGCADPGWLWLLLFFLPLLVYLLYFPFKVHYDRKREHLRHLLIERKLLKQAKAEEIRASVEEQKQALKAEASGGGTGGAKKKYKWDIKAADQYLWASSSGGGAMKVDFGKMGAPASAPKSHHSNKVLTLKDGTVLKGEAAEKAIAEMKAEEEKEAHLRYEREIALAEELERAGKLEESGEFWLRWCPCCRDILIEDEGQEVFDLEHGPAAHGDGEGGPVGRGKKGGHHQRGDSLFNDVQAQNAANPAATYGK